jgi:hypothetical protein
MSALKSALAAALDAKERRYSLEKRLLDSEARFARAYRVALVGCGLAVALFVALVWALGRSA